jgi:hypothetical protein
MKISSARAPRRGYAKNRISPIMERIASERVLGPVHEHQAIHHKISIGGVKDGGSR